MEETQVEKWKELENTEEHFEIIWTIWKKGQTNSDKIWTIWKKGMLKCEMIWKIWKKCRSNNDKI